MSRWLKVHQLLLTAAVLLLAVQVLLYVLVLKPRKQELRKARQEEEELQKRLSRSPWPTQAERLAAHAQELQQVLGDAESGKGLAAQVKAARDKASRTFAPYIKKGYETSANLIPACRCWTIDGTLPHIPGCQPRALISPSVLASR